MKTLLGYYELTANQQDDISKTILEHLQADTKPEDYLINHPATTGKNNRHIDTFVAKNKTETFITTVGCCSKKVKQQKWLLPDYYSPFVEVFVKIKNKTEDQIQFDGIYDKVLRMGCCDGMDYNYELCLIYGYNYAFLDGFDKYSEENGYSGVFVKPMEKINVSKFGEIQLYQIIPAYKSELLFVEQNERKFSQFALCKAVIDSISNREYINEKYEELSDNQLASILKSLSNH